MKGGTYHEREMNTFDYRALLNTKKSNDREKSIVALDKQLVSPSRPVAPQYGGFPHNDSVTLIQSNPSLSTFDELNDFGSISFQL